MKIDDQLAQAHVDQATHVLRCSHTVRTGRGKAYWMKVKLLHTSKTGKACVIVFGEPDSKSIRYVEFSRLKKLWPLIDGPLHGTKQPCHSPTITIDGHGYAFAIDIGYQYRGWTP